MCIRQIATYAVLVCLLVCCSLANAADKQTSLDRSLTRVASAMVRAYPELKEGKRTKEANEFLVQEFRSMKAADLSADAQKRLRRRKADFSAFEWVDLVQRFERANLTDKRCVFLLNEAKQQRMTSTRQYIFTQLMKGYLADQIAQREDLSRSRLRRVGKEYSAFIKAEKQDPQTLEEFISDASLMKGIDPQTGKEYRWVYVGAGPVAMRGSNRFRVVVYSSFSVGRGEQFCWIAYKGGSLGEWKRKTVLSKHEKMKRDCVNFHERLKEEKRKKSLVKVREHVAKPIEKNRGDSKKLKITIRELW